MSDPTEHLRDSTATLSEGSLLDVLGSTLRFEYYGGAVSHLDHTHTTGWRTLPFTIIAENPFGKGCIEYEGGRRTYGEGPRAGLIRSGVRHCCTMTSKKAISRWAHVNFFVFGRVDLMSLIEVPETFFGKSAKTIGDINEELAQLGSKRGATLHDAVRRTQLGLYLLEVILSGVQQGAISTRMLEMRRLMPAIECVQRNLDRAISMEELARRVHLSPSRFHAVFREIIGIAPRDYIVRQRIQKAQELLLGTELSMSEVSAQVGYDSVFHFSRTFKKHSGMSPSVYRENARKMKASG